MTHRRSNIVLTFSLLLGLSFACEKKAPLSASSTSFDADKPVSADVSADVSSKSNSMDPSIFESSPCHTSQQGLVAYDKEMSVLLYCDNQKWAKVPESSTVTVNDNNKNPLVNFNYTTIKQELEKQLAYKKQMLLKHYDRKAQRDENILSRHFMKDSMVSSGVAQNNDSYMCRSVVSKQSYRCRLSAPSSPLDENSINEELAH